MAGSPPWIEDEVIAVLDFYCKHAPDIPTANSEKIRELTKFLNRLRNKNEDRKGEPRTCRTQDAVHLRLRNFVALDSNHTGKGLDHVAKEDKKSWKKFYNKDEFSDKRMKLKRKISKIKIFVESGSLPSEKRKKEIYDLYKILFKSSFPENKKISLIYSLFLFEPWSCRVVKISKKAICKYKKHEFDTKTTGFHRDHFVETRKKTVEEMLEKCMPYEEWWELFWENDKTAILTKEEHDKKKTTDPSETVDIDWTLGYFQSGLVGFRYTKKEAEFLKKLIKENNIKC